MDNYDKSKLKHISSGIVIGALMIGLLLIDINFELSKLQLYINFKNNIKFIVEAITTVFPVLLIILIFIAYKVFSKKWIFRVEKLNLGGVSIICDNPEKLFKQQVKNFLNTKRTLFKINEDKDNFYDTIKSYYSVYQFIREEIRMFDPKLSKESESYITANKMIQELNKFLTSHQSDFRRWYEYVTEEQIAEIYNKDIDEIQKNYRNYSSIVKDFKKLNELFLQYAKEFDIDTDKWTHLDS